MGRRNDCLFCHALGYSFESSLGPSFDLPTPSAMEGTAGRDALLHKLIAY